MLSGIGTDKRPGPTDNLSADQSVTSVESRVGDVVTRLGVVPKMIYWLSDKGEFAGGRIGRIICIKEPDLLTYEAHTRFNLATSCT